MQPILVTPFHDPGGSFFRHLVAIEPGLKRAFSNAVLGLTPATIRAGPAALDLLRADPFYVLFPSAEAPVGQQWSDLYRHAVSISQPEQVLDLCFLDRLAFILQTGYREVFLQDILGLDPACPALLFCRSERAWNSHPPNYRQIEQFAVRAGQLLFGQKLDYTWCHLRVRSARLDEVLKQVHQPDFSMQAEIVLGLMDSLQVKEVDWLEWEDPFLLGQDGNALRCERENSRLEAEKRLAYILPVLQILLRFNFGSAQAGEEAI